MQPICCPLCHTMDVRVLETLDPERLNRAWQRSYCITTKLPATPISYTRCSRCDLRFFAPAFAGDADLYVQLQTHDWYYTADKPEYALAVALLPVSGQVLEVGSGKAAFASRVGKNRYTGLEFNDAAIARAAEEGVRLQKQTIESHAAERRDHYASVVAFQVLEHVTDPSGFVRGCVDALAPGGTLLLAVPDHDGLCGLAQNNILDMPPHHVSHWTSVTMNSIAQLFGLESPTIVREPISPQHVDWAARAVVERRLRHQLGMRDRLLDDSLLGRLVGRIAARRTSKQAPNISSVTGHTILASYRKPGLVAP
jgi:SAM-dependent methyltransferase